MIALAPVTLAMHGVRLEPLAPHHAEGLRAAAHDGAPWQWRITSVPAPDQVDDYIARAIDARAARCAFAVRDAASGQVLGSTGYPPC